MFIDFREEGRLIERNREKHRFEREILIGCVLYTP